MGIDIQSNADHPLECECVDLVSEILHRERWPADRIRVSVAFGFRMGTHAHSRSDLDVTIQNKRLNGRLNLFFNALFLQQKEGVFLEHVVPHEVAHALVIAEAKARGIKVKDHGPEWVAALQRISPGAIATPKIGTRDFDDAAIRIYKKGAIPALCKCHGEAFHVITEGESAGFCPTCGEAIEPVGRDQMPDRIRADYDFIQGQSLKNARTA